MYSCNDGKNVNAGEINIKRASRSFESSIGFEVQEKCKTSTALEWKANSDV